MNQSHTDEPMRAFLREASHSVSIAVLLAPMVQEGAFDGIFGGLNLDRAAP